MATTQTMPGAGTEPGGVPYYPDGTPPSYPDITISPDGFGSLVGGEDVDPNANSRDNQMHPAILGFGDDGFEIANRQPICLDTDRNGFKKLVVTFATYELVHGCNRP